MNLNIDKLRNELSGLIGTKIESIEVTSEESKYSFVYFIRLEGPENGLTNLVLKEETWSKDSLSDCAAYYHLYKYVLEPFKLNSPKIYGFINIDCKPFLVTEYISHETNHWDSHENYNMALNWLLKKDKLFTEHAADMNFHGCIGKKVLVHEQCLGLLKDAFINHIIPSPCNEEYDAINDFFMANVNMLDRGMQTVSHNDFHIWNVLFGKENNADSVYVVDWTSPNKCSVTFDLAYFTHFAPDNIKSLLIDEYRKQIDFPEFDKLFEFSRSLVKLIELSWLTFDIIKASAGPKVPERVGSLYNDLLKVVRGGKESLGKY